MGKLGCSTDGNLDVSKFNEPMPWIGIYIAAASLACCIAMAADAFHGFRYRKLWFPSKFFSLNATTLTLIAVATKLSVDLNTPMPRNQDQLAKLSSGVLFCTMMGNSMPSLGAMENQEILMNMMALAILVITVIVNIGIQLGTGVIYVFWKEHAFIMFIMLILLVDMSSSALAIPTIKHYFEQKYNKKHKLAMKECTETTCECQIQKLKNEVSRYWMMAHTSNPQFVVGRSVTCTASGAFCLLSALVLAEAMLRTYMMPWGFKFCDGESDYKWSTTLILMIQTIAVVLGTIAPAFRWFTSITFRCPRKNSSIKDEFKVERYWIQTLLELKECPLVLRIHSRNCRKLVHDAKNKFLDLCIAMQKCVVLGSKVVHCTSVCFGCWLLSSYCFLSKLLIRLKCNMLNDELGSDSQPGLKIELSRFVLHLEGEEDLVAVMMRKNCDATDYWLRVGKKKQPKHLIRILEKASSAEKFKGVEEFDSELVPSFDSDEPPNSWALPVVTLASIAVALPNVNSQLINQLIGGIDEGLAYARLIEDNLETRKDMNNVRKAAEIVWIGVDLYHKWLDVDLQEMSQQGKCPKEILEQLVGIAKDMLLQFQNKQTNECLKDNATKWPVKVLAANSMYRISETLLLDFGKRNYQVSERMFEALTIMISDIFHACLTNIPRLISMKCVRGSFERRMHSIRHATFLLGKTEKILRLQDQQPLLSLDPDKRASIDEWRSFGKQQRLSFSMSSSSQSLETPLSSPEVHLYINGNMTSSWK
ncbi:hypothetical protein RJ641_035348 [Dillenia turbinata]|uniref:Uncharacterized protein n=1 Tax=Dillenia turbinata TaxID=194707 RepID=A0AAN8ZIF5_9MAGN